MLKNGKWVETPTPLLPGYVFVYSEENDVRREQFLSLNHVIRVLSYNDGSSALMGHDLEFADWLWRLNGRIDVMKAIQVGERVEIVDGIFKQLHGTITRMDRRRRTVRVELDTQGALRHIWLAYEIVEKLEDKSGKAL